MCGSWRMDFRIGAQLVRSSLQMLSAADLLDLAEAVGAAFRTYSSRRLDRYFKRGTMNISITSLPSLTKPLIAPYIDVSDVLSFCNALSNIRVIRVCKLFVDAKRIKLNNFVLMLYRLSNTYC